MYIRTHLRSYWNLRKERILAIVRVELKSPLPIIRSQLPRALKDVTRRNGRGIMTNRLQKIPCSRTSHREHWLLTMSINSRDKTSKRLYSTSRIDRWKWSNSLGFVLLQDSFEDITVRSKHVFLFIPLFLLFFSLFLSSFFFIFKRKRYSYVISAWEKRRFISSTRVHPRPPFLSVPLQSPLNPSSNWKRTKL